MITLFIRRRAIFVCFDVSVAQRHQSTHTHSQTHTSNHAYNHICKHTYAHIRTVIPKNGREGLVFAVLGQVGQPVVWYYVVWSWIFINLIHVYLDSKELVAMMKGHESVIHAISVHASGRFAITTSTDTAQLWDLDSFQRKRKLNVKENVGIVKVRLENVGKML